MLSFVGLGLYDEKSITVRGVEVIRGADFVFLENYTSKLGGAGIEKLEKYYEKDIEILQREDVEVNPGKVLEAAKEREVVILVAGDSMSATTHVDLRLRANALGIETKIIHGTSSITAACGLTGLQNYRFGKSTTIPFEPEGKLPDSIYQTIRENRDRGLHTLVYLDIKVEQDRYMKGNEAAEKLMEIGEDCMGIVIARAGSQKPHVVTGRLKELMKMDFGEPLHLMIIPGDLHHMEMEALESFTEMHL
jgi:diphthine synthase